MLNVNAKKLGTIAVLRLGGQIVTGETEILRHAVQSLTEIGAIKLDFARVTMVDAGGLGVMLALREQAESEGVRFELANVTRQIMNVLELTRLNTVFKITSGVEFFPASRNRRESMRVLASCA